MPSVLTLRLQVMERVFYLRKGYRDLAIRGLLAFVFSGLFGVYFSLTDVPKDRAIYAALLFGLFWGFWTLAAAWMLLTYWRGSLSIEDGQICQQGGNCQEHDRSDIGY
jgi:hypothetical protein